MALLLAVLPFMPSCGFITPVPSPEPESELLFSVPETNLKPDAGTQFAYVTSPDGWVIVINYAGGQKDWLTVTPAEGDACDNLGILLKWAANPETESRKATITAVCGEQTSSVTVNQYGKGIPSPGPDPSTGIKSDPVAHWLELPATDDPSLFFITHEMTVGSYSGRNYSFYFDTKNLLARWVAYPLNKGLITSGGRTNEWGVDPKVPRNRQAYIVEKGFSRGTDGRRFDRGHQLPSADRLEINSNKATFYGTNMTPQLSEFNQNCWASLESAVRSWSYSFDTLYVVTGVDVRGARESCTDNDGKNVTIPTGYWKALLGYKKGGQFAGMGATGGYTGIAFYFDHKNYTDTRETLKTQSMSIDELEEELDMDFFVNLPAKIGQSFADKAESKLDQWWFK